MIPEDRELLQGLRRQQLELQQALARLDAQLSSLESRTAVVEAETAALLPELPPLPPIPTHDEPPPFLPPIPVATEMILPNLPPLPKPPVREPKPSLEFHFGRWLIRISAVFGLIVLALLFGWAHSRIYTLFGPTGMIWFSAATCAVATLWGGYLERRRSWVRYLGRGVTGVALLWLYVTVYAACYSDTYRIVHSQLVAGFWLILWSGYVLLLAERKKSQILALIAITLAYFSTAINPVGRFTMSADLLLAGVSVILMIRNGWAALAYFSLAGSYLAVLRRLVIDADGEFVFDSGRTLHFWPYAFYLSFTWLAFTAAVWFCGAPTFRSFKRYIFLTLNNGAWAGLLLFTSYISGYGHGPTGWILLATGFVLLITSRFVGWTDIEPEKVMAAYAAQGLTLFTGGLIVFFTGMTRSVMLTLATLLLGCAGTFAADAVLLTTTYVAAFFATGFLIWDIGFHAHHPWLLGFGGALVMLINAWMARSDIRHSPKARSTLVDGAAYYCLLAVTLIFTALCVRMSENALPPALALAAVILTFSIYYFSLYELPPLAQILLLAAQGLVIFPIDTGEELPWWTTTGVAAATLILITWWARQRVTRTSEWTLLLTLVYGLALVGLTYETVRPWADLDGWMVIASLISVAFLLWGAFTRVWQLAAVGQLFLAIALYHFFIPPGDEPFPWKWWAAALPLIVVFSTARAVHGWLDLMPETPDFRKSSIRLLAYGYQLLALAMLIRWVSAVAPPLEQIAAFIFLGTLVLSINVRVPNVFGIRCSYVLSLLGLLLYLENLNTNALEMATVFNALAFLCFLFQPTLLRRRGASPVTSVESWVLILLSVGACLFFLTNWVAVRYNSGYLTMNWALFGLFLFLLSPLVREPRFRWCGLAVLVVSIARATLYDIWGLTLGYRVLTLTSLVLMFICLGIGYVSLRSGDRTRNSH